MIYFQKIKYSSPRRGFTIIEVLLAAILLAAGLFTIFTMANRAVFAHVDIFKTEIASSLADETMSQIRLKLNSLPEKTNALAGDHVGQFPDATWKAEITPTDNPRLFKVNVKVRIAGELNTREFSLSSYMIR